MSRGLPGVVLYDYSSLHYKLKHRHGIPFRAEHLEHSHCSQLARTGPPAIPNLLGAITSLNCNSKDASVHEDFYCIVVALFIPWSVDSISKPKAVSW